MKSNDDDENVPQVEPDSNCAQFMTPLRKPSFITTMEEKSTEQKSKRLKGKKETNSSLNLKNEPLIQEHCLNITTQEGHLHAQ